jgi:hypothetical protein
MKKVIPGVLVLVAVVAAFVIFKKRLGHHTRATELVPTETIFFAHLPDLRRSAGRWPKTALAQIGEEPEVQAFLAKPRAQAAEWKEWEAKLARIARIMPGEAFVAVTSIEGPEPRFLAGLSFSGRKAEVESLLAEPRAEFKRAWPAGKSEVTTQGKTEIETFAYQDTTIGEAFCEDWYFVSNDMELLRRTIDAAPHGLGAKALSGNELFQKATPRLPVDGEAVLFAQLGTLTERVVSLLVASGQAPDPKQIAELKKMQAVAWGTKFDGALMRDTLFLLSPGNAAEPPLARSTLAFSGADTFLTYALALPTTFEVPESSLALGMFVPGFAAMEKGLADQGLKWTDLGKAFGPEFGVVVNWAQASSQPSALFAMDVRDGEKARGFVNVFTGGVAGNPPWGREEKDGVTLYQSPATAGLVSVTPCLALTGGFLVLGFSQPEVTGALGQLKSGQAAITAVPAFAQASKDVGAPTSGFGYLDLKTLFERGYGTLRPLIAMSLAFSSDAGKYLDAGKLPSTEAISKHLTPSIYSQSVTPDGTLVESVGTLTFNQVIIGTVGGVVAAAFPMIENAFAGGLKLDPSILSLTPSAPTPAPPSENPPVPPVPEPAISAPEPPVTPPAPTPQL